MSHSTIGKALKSDLWIGVTTDRPRSNVTTLPYLHSYSGYRHHFLLLLDRAPTKY